jgi:hypothetical protein
MASFEFLAPSAPVRQDPASGAPTAQERGTNDRGTANRGTGARGVAPATPASDPAAKAPGPSLNWPELLDLLATGAAAMAHFGPNHIDIPKAEDPAFLERFAAFIEQQAEHVGSPDYVGHLEKIAGPLNGAIRYARNGGEKGLRVAQKAFELARPAFARVGLILGDVEEFLPSPFVILHMPQERLPYGHGDPGGG